MAEETTETLPARLAGKDLELAYSAIMDGTVVPALGDPEAVSRAIMERIAEADDFESAFAPQSLDSWAELYEGRPVLVREVRLNRSTIKPKPDVVQSSVYAVVDIALLDEPDKGDVVTVQCGGRNVLVQLVKMLEKNWLDKPVRLVAKPTGDGNSVYWLEAA